MVIYRNTARYPIAGIKHFRSQDLALAYVRKTEPQTPLLSLDGQPIDPPMTHAEWMSLKIQRGWEDYDFRKVFGPGGSNAQELAAQPASSVQIYTDRLTSRSRD